MHHALTRRWEFPPFFKDHWQYSYRVLLQCIPCGSQMPAVNDVQETVKSLHFGAPPLWRQHKLAVVQNVDSFTVFCTSLTCQKRCARGLSFWAIYLTIDCVFPLLWKCIFHSYTFLLPIFRPGLWLYFSVLIIHFWYGQIIKFRRQTSSESFKPQRQIEDP